MGGWGAGGGWGVGGLGGWRVGGGWEGGVVGVGGLGGWGVEGVGGGCSVPFQGGLPFWDSAGYTNYVRVGPFNLNQWNLFLTKLTDQRETNGQESQLATPAPKPQLSGAKRPLRRAVVPVCKTWTRRPAN